MTTLGRAYLRVSDTHADWDGASLKVQREDIERYGDANDIAIIGWYEERWSGTTPDRREYQRLLGDLRRGEVLLIWKLDRSGRNNLESFRLYADLEERGVKLVSITEPGITNNDLVRNIMTVMNAEYSKELAKKVRPGMLYRAREGRWVTRVPRFYVMGEDHRLTPDPEQPPDAAQRMFQLFLQTRRITFVAEAYGFNATNLTKTLRNHCYLGEVNWQMIHVENAHPALVERETFDAVQRVLDERKKAQTRERDYSALLTGKLFVRDTQVKMYRRFYPSRAQGHEGEMVAQYINNSMKTVSKADHVSVRAEDVDRRVIEWLKDLQLSAEDAGRMIERRRRDALADPYLSQREGMEKALSELGAEQVNTARLVARGVISEDTYGEMRRAQAAEETRIRNALASLPPPPNIERDIATLEGLTNIGERVALAWGRGDIGLLRTLIDEYAERIEVWGAEANGVRTWHKNRQEPDIYVVPKGAVVAFSREPLGKQRI